MKTAPGVGAVKWSAKNERAGNELSGWGQGHLEKEESPYNQAQEACDERNGHENL